jgi:hypothetical protein
MWVQVFPLCLHFERYLSFEVQVFPLYPSFERYLNLNGTNVDAVPVLWEVPLRAST